MGYYKNVEVEQQAEVDRIVAWYRDNRHQIPTYVMSRVLVDKQLLDDLIEAYERELFASAPKRPRNRKPKIDWSMTSAQGKIFALTMLGVSVVNFTLALMLVVL